MPPPPPQNGIDHPGCQQGDPRQSEEVSDAPQGGQRGEPHGTATLPVEDEENNGSQGEGDLREEEVGCENRPDEQAGNQADGQAKPRGQGLPGQDVDPDDVGEEDGSVAVAQGLADNVVIAGAQGELMEGDERRQQWRILDGLDITQFVEQAITPTLGDGGAEHVINRPVPS